jgi:hypothetical protein
MAHDAEPIKVLTVARLRGITWNPKWCRVAAQRQDLELLQWLHRNGCPWSIDEVATAAVCKDSVDTLKWLHSVELEWSHELKQRLLFVAFCDHMSIATWLREQRAPRPSSFVHLSELDDVTEMYENDCWPVSAVQWQWPTAAAGGHGIAVTLDLCCLYVEKHRHTTTACTTMLCVMMSCVTRSELASYLHGHMSMAVLAHARQMQQQQQWQQQQWHSSSSNSSSSYSRWNTIR